MSDGVYLWFLLQNEITITAQQYVNLIQVAIAQGFHLFPFRTEKLSLVTPMVLRNSGRVGSRRFSEEASVSDKDTEALFVLYTSGTAPLNPCHALLQTYFSASFVILLLSLQNKVGVK